ncbi:60S ribosomal protein L10a [Podospora fimiseda]|uniref:60S ribosomal protein L10a n=1 Tax=Podospora fimiseda TaxID=252190 RepID=A0AAN7BWM4_9PEZI|nr:60S ribosomal protein L10a [Podospora fimiseda]
MAKITVDQVRTQVEDLLVYAHDDFHKRNSVETDTQRDKRFSGSIRLPFVPRPDMAVCLIGNQHDVDRARHHHKSNLKNLFPPFDDFIASDTVLRRLPRLLRQKLSRRGKFPTPLSESEDLEAKLIDVKSTIKFQLKHDLCMAVAVGNVNMTTEQLVQNLMLAINYLVSLLKKGWQNVKSLVIKSTMSPPPPRLY